MVVPTGVGGGLCALAEGFTLWLVTQMVEVYKFGVRALFLAAPSLKAPSSPVTPKAGGYLSSQPGPQGGADGEPSAFEPLSPRPVDVLFHVCTHPHAVVDGSLSELPGQGEAAYFS